MFNKGFNFIHLNFMLNDLTLNFIRSSIKLLLVFLPILVAEYFFSPKYKPSLNLSASSGNSKEFSFKKNKLGQVGFTSGDGLNPNVAKEKYNV